MRTQKRGGAKHVTPCSRIDRLAILALVADIALLERDQLDTGLAPGHSVRNIYESTGFYSGLRVF